MTEQTQNQSTEEQVEKSENIEQTTPTIESLQEEISALQAQLKDEQLRALAAKQNIERRHAEELQNAHKFAGAAFAKEMLPIKDFLEMALQDTSGNFDALKMGVEMTLKQLVNAFNAVHITEINPIGQTFDPNLHQAMRTEEDDSVEPNTVIAVMQKGYTLNDRILRPALVATSIAKS